MTTQNKNVPTLRFAEFEGEWQEKSLGSISDVRDGTHDSPKYVESGYPFITSKNLLKNGSIDFGNVEHISLEDFTKFNKRSGVNIGDILFGMIGTIGNPVIVKNNGFAIKNVALIKEKEELKNYFLIHYLNSPPILKQFHFQNAGGTQKFIALGLIRELNINVPTLPEQQKIAAFLTAVDEKIQQLAKKKDLLEQYKKGVMQKIFNQEIRFKDDNGNEFADWELTELKEIAVRVKDKNKSNEINKVLTNSATRGIVNQQDYFDKDIANQNNLEGYYIVEKDDFVYNPRISTSAPVGPIKRNNLEQGLMSPLYSVFRFNTVNLDFIEQFFETRLWHDYLKSIANYGARHDRMNITVEGFFEMPILLPTKPEQLKIARFLSAIDDKINLVNQQLEKTKEYKKGLLQQMFV